MSCDSARAGQIREEIETAKTIAILGHVRPDGDAVGSCLGLKRYINLVWPEKEVTVYLERIPREFLFLAGASETVSDFSGDTAYDLCFMLDCSDMTRPGEAAKFFNGAKRKVCIDHHITNDGMGDICVVKPSASSTSEVICSLIDTEKLDAAAAECLYLGIVHDTGVFKHSNTSEATMITAGRLITMGARPALIIDNTFYKKTYGQNRALGYVLTGSKLLLEGRLIAGSIDLKTCDELGILPSELDGIIDQLRVTEGVEAAMLISQLKSGAYKVSLRSNGDVDVSSICASFGGGGHVKAAGCELEGTPEAIIEKIAAKVKEQLR